MKALSNQFSSAAEYHKFAVFFLYKCCPSLLKRDYDASVGELISAMHRAEPNFDETRGVKKSTYFWKVCLRRFLRYRHTESQFYDRHSLHSSFLNLPSKETNPLLYLQYEELKEKVRQSALSARSKEIVLIYIDDPFASFADIGRQLGVTRQAVENHIRSSKQYLKRYNILLD